MVAKNTSYADFIADWRRLLTALDANGGSLPDLTTLRPTLESILAALEVVVTRQDAIRVESKENAAYAQDLLLRGSDVALRIRAALRSHLGPRNAKLAEYRVRVLAARRPRSTEPAEAQSSGSGRRRRRGSKAKVQPQEPEPEESEPEGLEPEPCEPEPASP